MRSALICLLLLCLACTACHQPAEQVLNTTPAFDSALVAADRQYDRGDKSGSLQRLLAAHSHAGHLLIADEIAYFTHCNIIYGNAGNYDHCLALADSMLLLLNREDTRNRYINRWVAVTYNVKADALFARGLYNDAYDNYYQAQRLAREQADTCSLRTYAYSLAMVLYRQQRYSEAAASFKEAYRDAGHCSEDFNLFYFKQELLDNTGLCYNALKQYDSAMACYTRALAYLNENTGRYEHKDTVVYEAPKAVVYGNMAEVFVHTGRYDTAKAMYIKSISINLRKGYTNSDAITDQAKLAGLYYSTGDTAMMHRTLQYIKAELDTLPNPQVAIAWNKLMWQYAVARRDTAAAYRYLSAYIAQNDAYTAANKTLMATDLDTRVKDIAQRYKINLLTRAREQQMLYLAIVTMLALMAVVIGAMVWRNARRSLRNVRLLTELNGTVSRQKEQLELALEELKEKDRDKSRILKSVAHDVMNPIAAIASLTDILANEAQNYTAGQVEIMDLIKEACNNSLSLSRDILEASTELSQPNAPRENTDLNILLGKTVELLSFQAQAKGQQIAIVAPAEHVHCMVYKDKLRRVVSNLVSNAIKFSYNDTKITVALEVINGQVRISVQDKGMGIAEKNKPYIFDMFTDARMPGTQGEAPHGLGLSISLHIARAHGGTVWFESTEGEGATFYLEFPYIQAQGRA